MNQAVRVKFDTLRSLGFGSFAAGYTQVGTNFAHPIRLLVMQNLTDGAATISFDGVTDHMVLPSGGQVVFDFASDTSLIAGMWSLSIGDSVWVKENGAAPTVGSFYVSGAYGKGE